MTPEEKAAARALKTQIRESSGRVALLKFDLNRMAKILQVAYKTITDLTQRASIDPDGAETMSRIPSAQRIIDTCEKLDAERAVSKKLKASLGAL